MKFRFKNTGGEAGFKFFCENEEDDANQNEETLRLQNFLIYPREFFINKGETMELYVCFLPKSEGIIQEKVILACDNQTSSIYTLEGKANVAELQVHGINNHMIDYSLKSLSESDFLENLKKIYFDDVLCNIPQTRKITIKNITSVKIPYHWSVFSTNKNTKIEITDTYEHRFHIVPEKGFFEADEIKEFEITFQAEKPMPYYEYAYLILDDIPLQSIRNPPDTIKKNLTSNVINPDGFSPTVLGPSYLGSNSNRPSITYFEFELIGIVTFAKVEISPPVSVFPSQLSIHKKYPVKFTLKNKANGIVSFQVSLHSKSHEVLETEVVSTKGAIPPNDEIEIEVWVASSETIQGGRFVYLVDVENGDNISFGVLASFMGPVIKFTKPEIDFGLVKTYTTTVMEFEIENISDIPALVYFQLASDKSPVIFEHLEDDEVLMRDDSKLKMVPKYTSLKGYEKKTIKAVLDSKDSESIRDIVNCFVHQGTTVGTFLRAEVQRIVTSLSNMTITFPVMYAGLEYEVNSTTPQRIFLRNHGNISTTFKWEEINDPEVLVATVDPIYGVLAPKSQIEIRLKILPYKGGSLNRILTCKVEGVEHLLGFEILSEVHGLSVRYELIDEETTNMAMTRTGHKNLLEGEAASPFLGSMRKTQTSFLDSDLRDAAKGQKLEHLEFFQCQINKPFTKQFLVRNTSGIETKFHFHFEKYEPLVHKDEIAFAKGGNKLSQSRLGASPGDKDLGDEQSRDLIRPQSKGRLGGGIRFANPSQLNDREERIPKSRGHKPPAPGTVALLTSEIEETHNFSTISGASLTQTRRVEREARFYLSNNLGLALVCEPFKGVLPPHGEIVVKVTAFNDICGKFEDYLICEMKGLETVRFPAIVQVSGSPIVVAPNQVGISYKDVYPYMNLGYIMSNYGPLTRTVKLTNTGPKNIKYNWKLYNLSRNASEVDFFNLQIGEPELGSNALVSVNWNPVEPPESHSGPFAIEPMDKFIKGRKDELFTVSFKCPTPGDYDGVLVGRPQIIKGPSGMTEEEYKEEETIKTDDKNIGMVVLYLHAQAIAPRLFLDKSSTGDGKQKIKFEKWALVDCAKEKRSFILQNKNKAGLQFGIRIEGPFQLTKSFTNSTERHLLGMTRTNSSLKGEAEKFFNLVPSSYVQLDMKFLANVKDQADWPLSFRNYKSGNLIVTFSNGDEQVFDLEGVLVRPTLYLNESGFEGDKVEEIQEFGVVHINNAKVKSIYLSNPTKVPAKWKLNYVKYPTKKTVSDATLTKMEKEDLEKTDDPSVWEFALTEVRS